MRLFIAIELSEPIRAAAYELALELRQGADHARLTRPENLHLTLAFLGDTPQERLGAVRRCMEHAAGAPFTLELDRPGAFRRREGDIWWLGARRTPPLCALERRLRRALTDAGFHTEEREFAPHITLCRDVRLRADFDREALAFPGLEQQVDHITLFESRREKTGMVYVPRARTELRLEKYVQRISKTW